ncbi:mucin-2-like [Oppia nitens]|uniref:mucin-2-like n=1 Tax=Oppia nitens TaxID=1686743 RepID=UPI0023DB7777|nr:mucin-2-like [Oppia nitens]
MRLCGKCLNHGHRIHEIGMHVIKCTYKTCQCDKCAARVQTEVVKTVVKTNSIAEPIKDSIVAIVNGNNGVVAADNNNVSVQLPTTRDTCTTTLETRAIQKARQLSSRLAKYDVSDDVLRTAVLYAVLKQNNLNIDDTIDKLYEARTLITESIVSEHFGSNESNDDNDSSSDESVGQLDIPCILRNPSHTGVQKARKSFPKQRPPKPVITEKTCDRNGNHINGNNSLTIKTPMPSVKTNEPILANSSFISTTTATTSSSKLLPNNILTNRSQTIISDISTNKTSLNITISNNNPVITSHLNRSPIDVRPKPIVLGSTLIPMNPNQSTYMFMPVVTNTTVSTNNENTHHIPVPKQTSTSVTLIKPTFLTSRPKTTQSLHKMSSPINRSTGNRILLPKEPLTTGPTSHKLIRLSTPSQTTTGITSQQKTINPVFQKFSTPSPIMGSNNTTNCLRNYRKSPVVQNRNELINNQKDKLCAKIITPEAALAAISAITTSRRPIGDEYILPDGVDDGIEEEPNSNDLKHSKSSLLLSNHRKTDISSLLSSDSSYHESIPSTSKQFNSILIPNRVLANKHKEIVVIDID